MGPPAVNSMLNPLCACGTAKQELETHDRAGIRIWQLKCDGCAGAIRETRRRCVAAKVEAFREVYLDSRTPAWRN